ncbi:retrovirus-related Pol polyprotein LINE-1 [Elysia marginata]|uniref:Retrovirus-related Pol polyprotein LINE-1 n=1 Tax=Elysia marginata TaxID=1093978 RepID=A0AAV4GS96_9GAST|nr:retrovirus-related Pol polyprotein LINE-1 [Elysia marginata]
MQKYIGCNKEIYACFIDYAKAFDRVHHTEMIRILEKIGIDGKDIRIIAHLYWYQKAAIRSGCDISDFTSIKRGVIQGCVLSPCLFNIYTEFIFRETSKYHGLNIGGRKFNNIRYADDSASH